MNPLSAIALASLARAEDVKQSRAQALFRLRRARVEGEPARLARDGRWAVAIARWSKAEDDMVGCSTVGCATA